MSGYRSLRQILAEMRAAQARRDEFAAALERFEHEFAERDEFFREMGLDAGDDWSAEIDEPAMFLAVLRDRITEMRSALSRGDEKLVKERWRAMRSFIRYCHVGGLQ